MAKLRAFTMPKWGIEMTEGTLVEWKIAEGDELRKGETICLIETAKITNEIDAEYAARVCRLTAQEGDELAVGALLAVFDEGTDASEGEVADFIASFKPATSGTAEPEQLKAETPSAGAEAAEKKPSKRIKIDTNRPISPEALRLAADQGVDLADITGSGRNGRISYQDVHRALRGPNTAKPAGPALLPLEDSVFASPLARRIAAIHGIDLSAVTGSGARGRISKKDVLVRIPQPAKAPSAAGDAFQLASNNPEVIAFDKIRKVVARRLTAAKQEIPHFYLRTSASADALLEIRKAANVVLGCKASINDFIIMAAAKSLAKHPEVNVQLHGEEIHRFPHADVAIAVASPKGLLTPIVRQANRMRIDQIADATKALIEKAHSGSLSYEHMDGGTFTISNLGMFGVENFDAIINPPQAAILAVGASTRVPREGGHEGTEFENRISFTLSLDHRAIDGALGASFLATFKAMIEDPQQLFD